MPNALSQRKNSISSVPFFMKKLKKFTATSIPYPINNSTKSTNKFRLKAFLPLCHSSRQQITMSNNRTYTHVYPARTKIAQLCLQFPGRYARGIHAAAALPRFDLHTNVQRVFILALSRALHFSSAALNHSPHNGGNE